MFILSLLLPLYVVNKDSHYQTKQSRFRGVGQRCRTEKVPPISLPDLIPDLGLILRIAG